MNWLVFLSGEDHIMDIISESVPEELIRPSPDGGYAFFFDSKDAHLTEGDVRSSAINKISVIRGVSKLVLNGDPGIHIEKISPAVETKEDFLKVLPVKRAGDIIISCDGGDDEEIPVRSPFESVFLIATADDCVKAAIRDIGDDFKTWEGLLRIYGRIESCEGSPAVRGWCSEDEQAWFLDSAEASVSKKSEDGMKFFSLMYLSEAESFMTILMQEWLKEKKRELNI